MPGSGYAVIDFETTGVRAEGTDRVVEIAVVHLDASGAVEGVFETLLNPDRDLGAGHIHGISAREILDAPSFASIAADFLALLDGRVIVAHNASFERRFLSAELRRLGADPGLSAEQFHCTMLLAREFLPGGGRALADCCDAFDIELVDAHRASADALATAELFSAYLASSRADRWEPWLEAAAAFEWPVVPRRRTRWTPRTSVAARASFLTRVVERLPDVSGPAEHLDYLAMLDRCLLDRELSAHEEEALVELANDLGISRPTAERLNARYFDDVVRVAWADGVLTDAELADIVTVAALLGVPDERVEAATVAPRTVARRPEPQAQPHSPGSERVVFESIGASADTTPAVASPPVHVGTEPQDGQVVQDELLRASVFRLQPGDLIVLTGDMSRPRAEWHGEIAALGFVAHPSVTKKVKLVVAADPDSLSGKARKARDYGIPIVTEAGLAALLAV